MPIRVNWWFSAINTKGDNFGDFLFTYLFVKLSKIGSTQNETDRTASYERVSIHLKVDALGLKLLNTWQSDQALHFLLVGKKILQCSQD